MRCKHCGCDRFHVSKSGACCQEGALILGGEPMPEELIELISEGEGVSKTSRTLNDCFRFAQECLPKGSHRLNLAGGHLKVTGMPYAMIESTLANSSTRSFIDDPAERELRTNRYDSAYRPSPHALTVVRRVLEDRPIARSIVNWARVDGPTARLVLKWPGSTASVRAFTVNPSTAIVGPRTVFFTRLDEDQRCYLRTDDPLYAPLMWPLAFPTGAPLLDRAGRTVDGDRRGPRAQGDADDEEQREHASEWSMRHTTLAMLTQPQRDADGACVLLPTPSPYGGGGFDLRRFSALEKLGRLGDEILIDRWLAVHDARLRMLQAPSMQRRLAGQFSPEYDGDEDDQRRGTYLPPSELGSPRFLRDKCADALACHRLLGKAVLFITMTTDLKDWPEIWTRLPTFDGEQQDPFDRAAIHAEAAPPSLRATGPSSTCATAPPTTWSCARPIAWTTPICRGASRRVHVGRPARSVPPWLDCPPFTAWAFLGRAPPPRPWAWGGVSEGARPPRGEPARARAAPAWAASGCRAPPSAQAASSKT